MSSVMYHPRFLVEVENDISLLPQTVGLETGNDSEDESLCFVVETDFQGRY